MRRSGMIVGHTSIRALGLDLVENRFEFPNGAHVEPDIQEVFRRVTCQFLLQSLVVRIYRHIAKTYRFAGKDFFRLYDDRLRHSDSTFSIFSLTIRRNRAPGAPSI